MSAENGWNDWGEAWRDKAPASPPSDIDAIERRVRAEQRRQILRAAIDLVACVVGVGISLWVILEDRPSAVILGLAGLTYSLFALAVTLGRRRAPGSLASRTVAAALDWELATARAGVRTSVGGVATAAAALLFLAVCVAVFRHEGVWDQDPIAAPALAVAAAYAVGAGLSSLWLYRKRRTHAERLERLLNELNG
ncbi:hypothetical protein [Caulobacter mirabilis]|uniref:Uncharacterized protein n=1 Tax=Caulobacter mirabilis TaxID=69666 RepID=A0A2D2AWR4_9CAUL|nr:hypothetical protein [Caulobacter mirabilis]ATQ42449.1 hypothetical protein CSW64_08485 [Caulobacter mirabilis]